MPKVLNAHAPSDIEIVQEYLDGAGRGLAGLAVAESLTDFVAERILQICSVPEPSQLLQIIHGCNFVIHRGPEWRLTSDTRKYLLTRLGDYGELERDIHHELFELSVRVSPSDPRFTQYPSYLAGGPGVAYHLAALDVEKGLKEYVQIALRGTRGDCWLGARLAEEQQQRGVLPAAAVEVIFLQGILAYEQGKYIEAIGLLREVTLSRKSTREVAISTHLVGRHDSKRSLRRGEDKSTHREAIKMLRRSLKIGNHLRDRVHIAHVSHTLALSILAHEPWRRDEALRLMDESLEILEDLPDEYGVAQVLNSYGQALCRRNGPGDMQAAEAKLWQSLGIGVRISNRKHQAMVLNNLSRLVGTYDREEGKQLKDCARSVEAGLDADCIYRWSSLWDKA